MITRNRSPGQLGKLGRVIKSPSEVAMTVNEQIDQVVDVIKAWMGLTEEDMKAIVKATHKRGKKVYAHLYIRS